MGVVAAAVAEGGNSMTIFQKLIVSSFIFLLTTFAFADESCGWRDPKLRFADGVESCLKKDTPFFNIPGLIENDGRTYYDVARTSRMYSVAVVKDQSQCPFSSGTAWDWHPTENPVKAIEYCEKKFPDDLRRSCKCEIILDFWDTPLTYEQFERKSIALVEQFSTGGRPLATVSTPEPKINIVKESKVNSLLTVSASAPDVNGLVTLSIVVNGGSIASLKVNNEEVGSRPDGRTTLQRFAQVGVNKFDVVAIYKSGDTQSQTVTVNRAVEEVVARFQPLNPIRVSESKPRDAVAIIIGIEKYRRVSNADFANRDAGLFYDYARRALGVRQENIKLLLDDKADASEILVAFKNWLPTRVGKGETEVYVFYSGHGLPSEDGKSLFFLPHEANRDLLERTAISQKEIVAAIQKSSPKSVTMFIDSCYSGQSRTGETLLASARPISVKAKQSSFPSNFTVISASAPDQISSSSPELRHGIFSYYLMRGMEGGADANGDKQITVAEMQTYLSEQVPRRAMSMNRTQQPQVVGDQSRVLVGR